VDLIQKKKIEIKYCQILMDTKDFKEEIDVLLVEGCVLTEHDERILKDYSRLARNVVAIGSCACFGGPAGLANQFHRADILRKMFPHPDSLQQIHVPSRGLPTIHEFACPIDMFVNVQYFVPGCPPESEILKDLLTEIVEGKPSVCYRSTVCDECPRKRTGESPTEIRRIIDIATLDPDRCLVEQGIMCMGKMTVGGCGAKCPSAGVPCEGCRGPSVSLRDLSPTDAPYLELVVRSKRNNPD